MAELRLRRKGDGKTSLGEGKREIEATRRSITYARPRKEKIGIHFLEGGLTGSGK